MQSMLRIFALGIVLLIFLPVTGFAGFSLLGQDHLKCYQVKDPMKVNDDVFLDSLQFGIQEDCKIIGKERFFCGSVEKDETGIFRNALDRICYRIECPPRQGQRETNPVPEDVEVQDQFGTRTLTNFNPHYLCTPAFKTGQLCDERAACGGTCVSTDLPDEPTTCRQGANGICSCLLPDIECGPINACRGPCRKDGRNGDCMLEKRTGGTVCVCLTP